MFDVEELKFDKDGLIPAVVQDFENGDVLMVAFMNRVSVKKTLETGLCHYWSRSRQKLWLKGETSGHTQTVREVYHDCDNDCLLVKVIQRTAACHTGMRSCFYTRMDDGGPGGVSGEKVFDASEVYSGSDILDKVYAVILDRMKNPAGGSYVSGLMDRGMDAVLDKVSEESAEAVEAVRGGAADEIVHETADLWFHSLVMLAGSGVAPADVYAELKRRRKGG